MPLLSSRLKPRVDLLIHVFGCAGTKQLKLDPSIYESIQKEKVTAGDVIYIESNSGAVKVCTQLVLSRIPSCSDPVIDACDAARGSLRCVCDGVRPRSRGVSACPVCFSVFIEAACQPRVDSRCGVFGSFVLACSLAL